MKKINILIYNRNIKINVKNRLHIKIIMHKDMKIDNFTYILVAFLFLYSTSTAQAQVAFDASNGGPVILGYDTQICGSSIEGALRYDSAAKQVQICKISEGGCPNIGNTCSDGTVYAGLSPDGNIPMYTTPTNAGALPWNNGNTTGIVNLYTPTTESMTGGAASTAAFIGVDSDSNTGDVQPFQAPEYCYNLDAHGHTDWYVPANDEFLVLRDSYSLIGGFPETAYWTASEVCCDAMWYLSIPSGGGAGVKRFNNMVRCVRKSSTPPAGYSWSNWGE